MKIIGSLTSPYVRKVRIMLAEKKIDAELVLDNVWDASTTITDFNPLGKVPCLVMDDGGAMFDSRVIAEYIDTLSPVGKLIPTTGRERAAVKTWEALADGVTDAGILVRLEKTFRNPTEQSTKWLDRQMEKVDHGFKPSLRDWVMRSGVMAINLVWRILQSDAHWVGLSYVLLTSIGKRNTLIYEGFMSGFPSALLLCKQSRQQLNLSE